MQPLPQPESSLPPRAAASGPLRLSVDRRSLVAGEGTPFFFLADTAWAIVWKGRPEEWARYLDFRAAQGYSVLQVNLLPWRWHFVDTDGNAPFQDGDPDRPNGAYFDRYERFLELAAARGFYTCLMLLWGGNIPELPAAHFSDAQALGFVRAMVARFSPYPVLWSLSGDAPYAEELARWEAIGAAVEAADRYGHPTTNHLPPRMNWRFLHHDSPWHDFHMLQTSHWRRSFPDIPALPAAYYAATPTKAVVNGEPPYEAHPSTDGGVYGPLFGDGEVRYAFWSSVLSGATMGHTYGGQGIWNWKRAGDDETPVAGPQLGPPWWEALHHPGAAQIARGARLLRALPWWRLRPSPERVRLAAPPGGPYAPACARVPDECWVVYLPDSAGGARLLGLEPGPWRARWFDPRAGDEVWSGAIEADDAGTWAVAALPAAGDWVLVLTR